MALKYIKTSLSIHLETYVDNFDPFSGLKLFTPFIKPIVPIDNKSSWSIFVFEYFLHTWTTNLKFFSINKLRASSSFLANFSTAIFSSSGVNGSGNKLLPVIYPNY